MQKIILNKSETEMANKVAYRYRHVERIASHDKEVQDEAIKKNIDIHYKAIRINRAIWLKNKAKQWRR